MFLWADTFKHSCVDRQRNTTLYCARKGDSNEKEIYELA